ncbi:MAG: EAL domain-containing protein [Alphaproteobacteria bacterium]|jgi:EAL domain-containing protein (putative c-di-GMP-specific phosphodiesterase class I)
MTPDRSGIGAARRKPTDAPLQDDAFAAALSETGLRAALAGEQFEVTFQPILSLYDGAVVGAETLLRWSHPEHGTVVPDRFIPFAERNQAIVDIGSWTIATACRASAAWHAAGLGGFPVSVNVSPAQFEGEAFVDSVIAILAAAELPPTALELEITENMFMPDLERTGEMLSRLSAIGVGIAVDDFGTGFTSLDWLHRLPVGKLKIDKSFVDGIDTDPHDAAVAGAIIRIGQSFSLRVVAEGVETAAQAQRLRELGCDDIQGYHIAPPMPADMFVAWLRDHPDTAGAGTG